MLTAFHSIWHGFGQACQCAQHQCKSVATLVQFLGSSLLPVVNVASQVPETLFDEGEDEEGENVLRELEQGVWAEREAESTPVQHAAAAEARLSPNGLF